MDEGGQVIPLVTGTSAHHEAQEDERAQEALGLRHALDDRGYAKVSQCWHNEHAARVDQAARRCYCGGCGAELDPYAVLEDVARRNAVTVATRRRLQRQIDMLIEKLGGLERQERNAKSRIRAAKKRAGLEVRADGWPLCPECGRDELKDRVNPVPQPHGALWCQSCRRVTAKAGRAA